MMYSIIDFCVMYMYAQSDDHSSTAVTIRSATALSSSVLMRGIQVTHTSSTYEAPLTFVSAQGFDGGHNPLRHSIEFIRAYAAQNTNHPYPFNL